MLGEHIKKLVGTAAKEVVVIADSVVDVNTSSISVDAIEVATFLPYQSISSKTMEPPVTSPQKQGVHIKINKTLSQPLHIVFEHTEEIGQYAFVEVAPNVEAVIFEHQIFCECGCTPTGNKLNTMLEFDISDNAKVLYNAFDTSDLNLAINRYFQIYRDAVLNMAIGMFGASCVSHNEVALVKQGAHVDSKMMMFVQDAQVQNHKIRFNHFAPNTFSYMMNHGVVAKSAVGTFTGIGFIEKGAHKADAQQESRIMTLDTESIANVHPILLIDEYDVIAGHAGSVGQVSDEALYYLQSRGLSRIDAQLLITEGFLRPVVENITDLQTKERIEAVIREKVGR
jgi:ABC-type transport system involved in Fe-S cluster assembly, permease component